MSTRVSPVPQRSARVAGQSLLGARCSVAGVSLVKLFVTIYLLVGSRIQPFVRLSVVVVQEDRKEGGFLFLFVMGFPLGLCLAQKTM